ncbi:MAG: Ig-like domain-containing protein, partial [Bacteroidota bacterium]
MNLRKILLWGFTATLVLNSSCQNPVEPVDEKTNEVETFVRGTVLRNDNLSPIANATVYDIDGRTRDTSKADGSFRLRFMLTGSFSTKVIGSAAGFKNDTVGISITPGVDTSIVLRVRADSTSPAGTLSSGKPANIVLIGASTENISIRGTGPNETSILTFEVRDSLGIPVGGVNKVKVRFTILGGPGGGEYVYPAESESDPLSGRVTTRISSGEKAGVVQVYATATVGSSTIKSSPVRLTISGGLPVQERFSISRSKANIAGGVFDNLRAGITVVVGDKHGNPVQPGTAIYFTTTGGIIQPSALTDKDGIATVDLISGNPRPANSVALITATTIGDSGTVISRNIQVTLSGATRILVPTSTVVVPDSGFTTFAYRVQDPNGLPIVSGSQINLTVDGPGASDLVLSGDVSKAMPDTDDPNATLFTATVRDTKLKGG